MEEGMQLAQLMASLEKWVAVSPARHTRTPFCSNEVSHRRVGLIFSGMAQELSCSRKASLEEAIQLSFLLRPCRNSLWKNGFKSLGLQVPESPVVEGGYKSAKKQRHSLQILAL